MTRMERIEEQRDRMNVKRRQTTRQLRARARMAKNAGEAFALSVIADAAAPRLLRALVGEVEAANVRATVAEECVIDVFHAVNHKVSRKPFRDVAKVIATLRDQIDDLRFWAGAREDVSAAIARAEAAEKERDEARSAHGQSYLRVCVERDAAILARDSRPDITAEDAACVRGVVAWCGGQAEPAEAGDAARRVDAALRDHARKAGAK